MDLYFEVEGEGEPLIVLHGLFGSLENWRPMSRKLANRFKVFLVDQRNHGRSPHSEEMNYALMAEDVRQLLHRQHLHAAHVLGHSMGGKTAMQLAVLHPENVRKLVVADIAPRVYSPRHQHIIEGMLALDLSRFHSRKEIEAALAPAVPELATRQFLLKNVARLDGGTFGWRLGLEEIGDNYLRLTEPVAGGRPFDKPALFVRGANSDYLTQSDFPAIQCLFPNAVLRSIPEAGHLLHVQNPDFFSRIVAEFLGQRVPNSLLA
ncbi:MAG TPA: alpha/beta fold hydrolase [Verrucomicrobiae bacterium]|nr:alpha/beta fold hydrolase [Verrucomicrobiae bacterium]